MIPEYRLIQHFLLLKSNFFFKREIKNQLNHLRAKDFRDTYNLVFNCHKNILFLKVISTYLELNNLSSKQFLPVVTNFMIVIAALMPILTKQQQKLTNYEAAKALLLTIGCQDDVAQWYHARVSDKVLPALLINNTKIRSEQLTTLKKLVHLSGSLFSNITALVPLQKDSYQFGCQLMLFYLFDLETRQTLLNKDVTNFNLKSIFSYEELFVEKLLIYDNFVKMAMLLEKQKFNIYIRIMNYSLAGNFF